MFDSFVMACHDEQTALRLNIKVNSENLLPIPQKYNHGSLRLPDDPSWPKIPQRKMIDDVGDPMQPPYVVTLNGTPRRSRSLVRAPQPRSVKFSASRDSENPLIYHCCQKDPNLVCQGPRRRPGCSDPRFKKVTAVQSHMTSTEPVERDVAKQMETRRSALVIPDQSKPITSKTIPEKDTTSKQERSRVTQQRAEKPGELKGTESIGIQTIEAASGSIDESALDSAAKQSLDIGVHRNAANSVENSREQCEFKTTRQVLEHASLYSRNNSVQSRTTHAKEQEKPLFSVTNNDEFTSAWKVDHPKNRDRYETKNWTSQQQNTEPSQQVGSSQGFRNGMPVNARLAEAPRTIKAHDERTLHRCTNSDAPMRGSDDTNREDNLLRIDNNETAKQNAIKHDFHIHYHQENTPQNGPTVAQKLHDLHSYRYRPVGTDSEGDGQDRRKKQNFSTDEDRMYTDWTLNAASRNHSSHVRSRSTSLRPKRKVRSGHHLLLNKKRAQSSEPRITNASKKPRDLHLKKTNSTFSKFLIPRNSYAWSSHEEPIGGNLEENLYDTTDVGTSYRPANDASTLERSTEVCDVKHDHSKKPYQRPSQRSAKITSSLDFEKQNFQMFKSPRTETDASTIQPTSIPIKTQQLLNKSYWEYYNKLKLDKMENSESPQQQYFCEIAMGAPRSKKRRATELIAEEANNTSQMEDQLELSLPEIRTLEQCSVLSTMINNTLETDTAQLSSGTVCTKQLYLNGNMRSSSDPTAGGTQSAVLKKLLSTEINETSPFSSTFAHEHKRKRGYPFGNKALKIKSIGEHPIIFFGCMVYAMIVFIPMIYEYLFYEDEDEWEDLSYVEIALDYIVVYCKDVLTEVFDTANRIFFKPV